MILQLLVDLCKCNNEKTVLIQVGRKPVLDNNILNLGFNISNSIHILGMTIDSELENFDSNFENIVSRLKKTVDFWERYFLTLPGRINVIKGLLTYLGCFLMPLAAKLSSMQNILDIYAVGKLNFSKQKITAPIEQGGIGLFNIQNFL
jgi:hypothetical protein